MIATPAPVAQEVADLLVEAGVRSILNFAPAVLTVPKSVSMRKVDLAIELQILSFYQLRRGGGSSPPPGAAARLVPNSPGSPANPSWGAPPRGGVGGGPIP